MPRQYAVAEINNIVIIGILMDFTFTYFDIVVYHPLLAKLFLIKYLRLLVQLFSFEQ